MNNRFSKEGFDVFNKIFKDMETKAAANIVKRSTKKVTQPIHDEIVAETPVGETGKLKESMKLKTQNKQGRVTTTSSTGSKNLYSGNAYYGGPLHYGHGIGSRKLGNSRTFLPPNPWIDRIWDRRAQQAKTDLEKQLWDNTVKYLKRQRNKAAKARLAGG